MPKTWRLSIKLSKESNTMRMTKKDLELEIVRLEGEQKRCNLELCNLLAHLSSSKFFCGNDMDGYIHVNDVHRRIMDARSHLSV